MFLKDLLFPKFCLGCGFIGVYICSKCQQKLSYLEKDSCLYCGGASLFGLTHPICKRKGGIDGSLSLFHYNDFLKKLIKNMKYRLVFEIWRELRLIIKPEKLTKLSFYKSLNQGLYLQPIPLHHKRQKERGFNQAEIITLFFKNHLNLPLANLLERKKETLSQAQIKKAGRRYSNILGAFKALNKDEVQNKNFILVDDVVTSGSTLKEAAKILKLAGAKKVFALTLAKG